MAGGITSDKVEHSGFNNGVDFLVSTPERVVHHIAASMAPKFIQNVMWMICTNILNEIEHLNLDDTRFIVMDEADTMFSNEIFEESLKSFLKSLDEVY